MHRLLARAFGPLMTAALLSVNMTADPVPVRHPHRDR
jgi:hypothetical protein